jgi:hypothetical protein
VLVNKLQGNERSLDKMIQEKEDNAVRDEGSLPGDQHSHDQYQQ